MASSTCETIRHNSGSSGPDLNVQVVSNGQSLQTTRAVVAATCYRAVCHKAANGRMNADGNIVEARDVER